MISRTAVPEPESAPAGSGSFLSAASLLLFGSGFVALVHETLFVRRFADLLGATTPAIAATLAAFLTGLAAGSASSEALFGRLRRPLLAVAALEAGIAAGVLLTRHLVALSDSGAAAPAPALAVLSLLLPTFFMGGTVPVMIRAAGSGSASRLYAANTAGGVLGALAVPFLWLPAFGVSHGLLAGAALNLLLAAAAAALAFRRPPLAVEAPGISAPTAGSRGIGLTPILLLGAASGAALLVLEVAWSRLLAQVHESSIHSFAVVLATFLAGLAAAARLAGTLRQRGLPPRTILAVAFCGGGLLALASPRVLAASTGGFAPLTAEGAPALARLLAIAIPVVFLPTLLAGMTLPVLLDESAAGRSRTTPGLLLAVNTAASVGGVLLAAFLLPPLLGSIGTVGAVGLGAAALGLAVLERPVAAKLGWLAAVSVAAVLVHPFALPRTHLEPGDRLLALAEGSHGVVATIERDSGRRLKLDNSYVIGGTGSTGDERMETHLPLLLHPAPRDVAFLGLGTGISAGAALLHPGVGISVAELVPEIAAAARRDFREANLALADDARVRLVVDDARSLLRRSPGAFDVVVGDLVVPWRAGEAALYTVEQFRTARAALRPGGLFCQWIPLFQMDGERLETVVASFLDVFPEATLWRGDFAPDRPALALVGHTGGAPLDLAAIARRISALRTDPSNPHLVEPAGLLVYLVGALDPQAPRFAAARRSTRDHPWLELGGAVARGGFVGAPLEELLEDVRRADVRGTPLERLPAEAFVWRDAGAEIAAATIALSSGREREAALRFAAAAQKLPPGVRRAIVGID